MKSVLAVLCLAASLGAQTVNHYIESTGNVALSSAATAFTIQQPATGAKQVTGEWSSVYCSAACVVTQSINGTAATTTAGTSVGVPGNTTAPASINVFTASNVGAGTTIAVDNIPAGSTFTFDLSKVRMGTTGNTTNYTFSIASMTGTVNIKIAHGEQQP